jgi:hypothetical protein
VFYFGLRSSVLYLRTLAEVRELAAPHHLLSVIGGFAFLHGLAPGCRSLTLVDTDRDALDHWRLVRALLLGARSLGDFVGLLSGWRTSGSFAEAGGLFTSPIDRIDLIDLRKRLDELLGARLRRLYARTYGSVDIDPARGEGRIGEARVRFTGYDLARNTYCWHFGTGNFAGEESFAGLQEMLRRLPERALTARFEELDYGKQGWRADESVVFLASNCESPIFTRGDAIFHRVLATARGDLRYISWLRDLHIAAPEPPAETPDALLASLGERPAWVLRLAGASGAAGLMAAGAVPLAGLREERTMRKPRELVDLTEYGRPLLVIDGGGQSEVAALLAAIAPGFLRVLWLPGEAECGRSFPDELRRSYQVADSSSSRAVSFTLRGLRAEL